MSNLVEINFHGELANVFGKTWKLAVSSVAEAINAINSLTNNRFNNFMKRKNRVNALYRLLINSEDFICEKRLDKLENAPSVMESNLIVTMPNLRSIDIIPCLEGASDILNVILGAILILVGAFTFGVTSPYGFALIAVGLGLAISGIVGLLSKPPTFEDKQSKRSYLFDGPSQTTGEGGPVPVGYGRLLIGSQVVSAGYKVYDALITNGTVSSLPITDIIVYTPVPAPTRVATSAFPDYPVTLSCSSNGKIHYEVSFSSTPHAKGSSYYTTAPNAGSVSATQSVRVNLSRPTAVNDYVYIHMYCTYRFEMSSASTKIYTYAYQRV